MSWIELKIFTDADKAESISEYLLMLGATSVTFADAKDQPILEPKPGETPLWQELTVIGLFEQDIHIQEIIHFIQQNLPIQQLNYQVQTLEDRQWQTVWQEHFQPFCVEEKLWICQQSQQLENLNAAKILLPPGLAFGTGTHPTTLLCLRWLVQQVQPNTTLIDYGSGSGILGIAALKLGAKKVYAVDIDPQAREASHANAELNGVAQQLQVIDPATSIKAMSKADMLVANILAQPLIELAPTFAELLRSKGAIGLSGILVEQVDSIVAVYRNHFSEISIVEQEGWAFISAKSKS